MPSFKTNAIVIHRADYRDNDRMLTLFSPEHGKISAICRGCKRPKSRLIAASELFCSGEYVFYSSREHVGVESCTVTDTFYPLRMDYDRLMHGIYLLNLCDAAIQPEEENPRLFLFLLKALAFLSYSEAEERSVTVIFEMGFVSLLGFRPLVGRCARCGRPVEPAEDGDRTAAGFSPEDNGVICPSCRRAGDVPLCREDLRALQLVMRKGLDALQEKVHFSDALFSGILEMVEYRLDRRMESGRRLIRREAT